MEDSPPHKIHTTIPPMIFSKPDMLKKPSTQHFLEFPQIEKELAKNKGGAGNLNFMRHSLSQALMPPSNIAYTAKHSEARISPDMSDKLSKRKDFSHKFDIRSRDLSHYFDKPIKQPKSFTDPTKFKANVYKMMERDFLTIYKNREILSNARAIEQGSLKLLEKFKKIRQTDQTPKMNQSDFNPEEQFNEFSQSLGALSSRKQVETLSVWLDYVNDKVQHESTDKQERFEKLMTTQKFVIMELVRQVTIQCAERGELLKKVIDQYGGLIASYYSRC